MKSVETLASQRLGLINKNNFGSEMQIVKYDSNREIWVKFLESGNLKRVEWREFCNGEVKNPFDKSVYGVGYIGEGKYTTGKNNKITKQYECWKSILARCYPNKTTINNATYKDCLVSEEWLNFQNFAKWYDDNFYKVEGERMHLDKDILVKGNKIYSSDTCIFVPARINGLFIKRSAKRGNLPIGVVIGRKKYRACANGVKLGTYNTPEEAFKVYKIYKEKIIKQTAEEYIGKIPKKLYDALINYQVEIND